MADKKVRLDKWLWACRFYKTRSIAQQAIDGGKVHYEGQRVKPSKQVVEGAMIQMRVGWDEREVKVITLADQRVGAPIAVTYYEETPQSIAKRAEQAEQRKLLKGAVVVHERRPTKKDRRQMDKFFHGADEDHSS